MTSWATVISLAYRHLLRTNPVAAQRMCLPATPHSLMVSALGLLLVFRTNSAYQRFAVRARHVLPMIYPSVFLNLQPNAYSIPVIGGTKDLGRYCK